MESTKEEAKEYLNKAHADPNKGTEKSLSKDFTVNQNAMEYYDERA